MIGAWFRDGRWKPPQPQSCDQTALWVSFACSPNVPKSERGPRKGPLRPAETLWAILGLKRRRPIGLTAPACVRLDRWRRLARPRPVRRGRGGTRPAALPGCAGSCPSVVSLLSVLREMPRSRAVTVRLSHTCSSSGGRSRRPGSSRRRRSSRRRAAAACRSRRCWTSTGQRSWAKVSTEVRRKEGAYRSAARRSISPRSTARETAVMGQPIRSAASLQLTHSAASAARAFSHRRTGPSRNHKCCARPLAGKNAKGGELADAVAAEAGEFDDLVGVQPPCVVWWEAIVRGEVCHGSCAARRGRPGGPRQCSANVSTDARSKVGRTPDLGRRLMCPSRT